MRKASGELCYSQIVTKNNKINKDGQTLRKEISRFLQRRRNIVLHSVEYLRHTSKSYTCQTINLLK